MTFALILRRAIDWFYRRPFSRVISETVFRYGACGAITLSVDAVSYALIYHFWLRAVISTWDSWLCRRISPLWCWFSHYVLHRFLAEPLCRLPHAACCGGQTVGALSIDSRRIYFAQLRLYEILVEVCGLWPTPSKCITSLAVALYSYLAARYYTFKGIYPEK